MSGLSEDTRALLDAARDGDDPSDGDRARVRAAIARRIALGAAAGAAVATASHVAGGATSAAVGTVGAGTATAATAGTVATTSIAAGAMGGGAVAVMTSLGAKIIVSVAIVGAVGAGATTYVKHEAAKRAVPTVSAAAPVAPSRDAVTASQAFTASPPPFTAPIVAPVAPPPPAPVVAAPPPVATTVAAPVAAPQAAPAAAPTTSALDAEIALLQETHAALRANDGDRALRTVAEHGRRFPSGQLDEEFDAARVFALCELGRSDEARDVASRFLREHPRSPLAPRVANACEANAPSTF